MERREPSVLVRTRYVVRPSRVSAFLDAAAIYLVSVRKEPACSRAELVRRADRPAHFVLEETFRRGTLHDAHETSTHALIFAELIAPLLEEPSRREVFERVLYIEAPPPLPRETRPRWEGARHVTPLPEPPAFPPPTMLAPDWSRNVEVRLDALELATGVDGGGLFAGKPDPCLVVAAYALDGPVPYVVGRGLLRLRVKAALPCIVSCSDAVLSFPVGSRGLSRQIALLAVAIEENGGGHVQRVYRDLQVVDSLLFWPRASAEPSPSPIQDYREHPLACEQSFPVEILSRNTVLSESVDDDVWVGASLAIVRLDDPDALLLRRFHFAAVPDLNDWVGNIRLRVG